MKTCPDPQQLSALYDGELPAASASALRNHVQACPQCQAELAQLARLSKTLSVAAMAQPAPDALTHWSRQALKAQIEQQTLQLTRWLSAAAAMVLFSSLLWLSHQPTAHTTYASTGLNPAGVSVGEVETLLLTRGELRGDSPAPRSLAMAQWLAADLSLSQTSEKQP